MSSSVLGGIVRRGVIPGAAGGVAEIIWISTYAADRIFVGLPKASPAYDEVFNLLPTGFRSIPPSQG